MYGRLIQEQNLKTGLDPLLIAAVIHQESSGNTYAVRYEPAFFKRYIQGKDWDRLGGYVPRLATLDTERKCRSTSYGLMQIMGQVARERGFRGEFLTELCDPKVNLEIGCSFLKHLVERTGSTQAALQRYNGGGDPNYAKKVFAHIDSGVCHRHLGIG